MLLEALLVLGRGRHGVKLLPLIDIDQQAIRLFRRGVEAAVDDAREHLRVAGAIGTPLLLRATRRSRPGRRCPARSPKASASARERRLARPQRDHVPHRRPALLAQRGKQPGEDERRLAAARRADDGDEAMRLYARDKFADRVVAAAEERRVLFAERLQAPVGADRRPDGGGGDRLAAQRGAKVGEAVRSAQGRLSPLLRSTQVRSCKEPGRRGIAARHQHRDHRERGVAGLPDERELALILLGVADPVLADEDRDGLGAADRLFERRNPPEARAKRAAVEEGAEALRAQPAVQLRRGGVVAAGVADKDVVGVAARHGGSVIRLGGMVNPARAGPLLKPRPDLLLLLLVLDLLADALIEPFRHARTRERAVVVRARERFG